MDKIIELIHQYPEGSLILGLALLAALEEIGRAYFNRNRPIVKCKHRDDDDDLDDDEDDDIDEDIDIDDDREDLIPYSNSQIEVNIKPAIIPSDLRYTDLLNIDGVLAVTPVFPESTDEELGKIHVLNVDPDRYNDIMWTLHSLPGIESTHRIPERNIA